jgi:predicted dehydrogenase
MITAAIIGFAHMHSNEVAQYLLEQPDTKLAALADIAPDTPEECDKRYTRAWNLKNVSELSGAPIYDDYRMLLDEIKPDYAYILCENSKKPQVAEECAKRGVNIIIEKPMAADLTGAEFINGLSVKYGIEILVNWPVAWRPYLMQMKKAIDEKLCGDLIKVRYLNGHTGPLGKGARHRGVSADAQDMTDCERSRIWWYKSETGGGATLDILCYGCYFSRWFFGKLPIGVTAIGMNIATPYADCEDNTAAIFRYDGKMATVEGSWTIPRLIVPAGPEAICTDGAVFCRGGADSGQFIDSCTLYGESIAVPDYVQPDMMKNMPWHLASHKLHGTPLFETLLPEFNLDVMRMLDAVIKSDRIRAEVIL